MPIYEYRCDACGFQKEYLQKMSDPLLTDCSECGKATLKKMVTAAGFQLKGSGWYVTDFRQGAKPAATGTSAGTAKVEGEAGGKSEAKAEGSSSGGESKPAAEAPAKKAESSPAAASSTATTSSGS